MTSIACVLLDVGGTLWPHHGPANAEVRIARLRSMLPVLSEPQAAAILQSMKAADRVFANGGRQDTIAFLREAASAAGLSFSPDQLGHLRQALCIPAASVLSLFPGAEQLLSSIQRLGLRCAIVSNADVRSGEDYRRDFASFGLEKHIQAYISSIDVAMRKPHPRPFLAALEQLQCQPWQAVVIGDSETNDIEPARRLGARTILVAIESSAPEHSTAGAIATSLPEAAALLERWVLGLRPS